MYNAGTVAAYDYKQNELGIPYWQIFFFCISSGNAVVLKMEQKCLLGDINIKQSIHTDTCRKKKFYVF